MIFFPGWRSAQPQRRRRRERDGVAADQRRGVQLRVPRGDPPQAVRGLPERERPQRSGTNCIKIGLPGKVILRKRKGLREVLFS